MVYVVVCSAPTRFSAIAGLSVPRISFWEALVNSGRPAIGRYSWFRSGSFRSTSSALSSRHQYMDPI